jgi:ParB/RepB/Spo0J family partition protein
MPHRSGFGLGLDLRGFEPEPPVVQFRSPKAATMTTDASSSFGLVALDEVAVEDRFRTDLGELADLVDSIRQIGLLHPLVITADRRLVAGSRRLAACRQLGWTHAPAHVVAGLDDAVALLIAERDENTCRKDMTPEEKIALGAALEHLERARAQERIKAHQAKPGQQVGQHLGPGKLPEPRRGEVRELVGAAVGLSGNRQLNTALHRIAMTQARLHPPARD